MKNCNEISEGCIPKGVLEKIESICSESETISYSCIFGSYLFGYDGEGANVIVYLESNCKSSYDMLYSEEFEEVYVGIRSILCDYFELIGKMKVSCEICYFGKNEIGFIRTTKWYKYIEETGYLIYSSQE